MAPRHTKTNVARRNEEKMMAETEELVHTTLTTPAGSAAHAVDLRKTYGTGQAAVHALAGVTVAFERGRFTAVMGPSGSGAAGSISWPGSWASRTG
jgi:ABC-type glutathione transport system ATPase component